MITLRSVYDEFNVPDAEAVDFLYRLLKQRTPEQSISHREMPTAREHTRYVKSLPYAAWYVIEHEATGDRIGSIYLSRRREIGVFIDEHWRGHGFGRAAVRAIMERHPGPRFLWNVNPRNQPSIRTVEKLGGRLIQWTYEI